VLAGFGADEGTSVSQLHSLVRPLLFLIAFSLLPSFYLRPFWTVLLTVVLLGYRVYLYMENRKMPPRWVLLIVQLVSGAAVWFHFQQLLGGEAGGTLLGILLVLKTYELRAKRDYFFAVLLSLLVLMSHALSEQGLTITLFVLLGALFVVTFLYALEEERWDWKGWKPILRPSLSLGAQALPLVILMFVMFPRFSTGFGSGGPVQAKTGVTDRLEPGSVAHLIPSDELMFRATFLNGDMPPLQHIYWRGAILDISDGMNWRRSPVNPELREGEALSGGGDGGVEIYLEPSSDRLLFTLEDAVDVSFAGDLEGRRVRVREGRVFELRQPLSVRERYLMTVATTTPLESAEGNWLQVAPPSDELKAWLRPMRGQPPEVVVRSLLQNFRKGYEYNLQPKPASSMEDFLFRTKSGFCEHYSGTLATLLRHLGVPARVVVGFQGGTSSLLGNYITVRGHDAHAWVEYHDARSGRWRRIDPTAQVAPARLAQGSESYLQAHQSLLPPWLPTRWLNAYFKTRAVIDQVDASWTGFLLGFDIAWQRSILARLGMDEVLFRALPVFLMLSLVLILALIYFIQAQRREPLSAQDQLYRKLLKILRQRGIEKAANEGPTQLLEKVAVARPDLLEPLIAALGPLNRLRYGGDVADLEKLNEIQQALRHLRKIALTASRKPFYD